MTIVAPSGDVVSSLVADSDVRLANSVPMQRTIADGGVAEARGIVKKSLDTTGLVPIAGSVALECADSISGVAANCVAARGYCILSEL
jgi:hypothetical protein